MSRWEDDGIHGMPMCGVYMPVTITCVEYACMMMYACIIEGRKGTQKM